MTPIEPPVREGTTHAAKDGEPAPRLPHEHDESSDSGRSEPRDVMRQAHDDVESGKTQTDRGEATDEAYRKTREEAPGPR